MVRLHTALIRASILALAACGPPVTPLKSATNLVVTTGYSTGSDLSVGILRFLLRLEADNCPTFDATLTVNGVGVPITEPGGNKPSSFYFVPTESCAPATYEVTSVTLPVQSSGLSVRLSDSSATFELTSTGATAITVERIGTESVRVGDTLRFHVTHPVAETSVEASIRPIDGDRFSAIDFFPIERTGEDLSVKMPQSPAGVHEWVVGVRGRVPVDTCSGFSACEPVFADFFSRGQVTVNP